MMTEYDFNEPLNEEPDGTYITIGQMQFFLNREDGQEKFKSGHREFMDYYNLCRVYNLVSQIMNEDEDAAIMYWDGKKNIVSMGFPTGGAVALALSGIESDVCLFSEDDDEDDEEDWGLFHGSPYHG